MQVSAPASVGLHAIELEIAVTVSIISGGVLYVFDCEPCKFAESRIHTGYLREFFEQLILEAVWHKRVA